jgi:hypothetical protein
MLCSDFEFTLNSDVPLGRQISDLIPHPASGNQHLTSESDT